MVDLKEVRRISEIRERVKYNQNILYESDLFILFCVYIMYFASQPQFSFFFSKSTPLFTDHYSLLSFSSEKVNV